MSSKNSKKDVSSNNSAVKAAESHNKQYHTVDHLFIPQQPRPRINSVEDALAAARNNNQ